ncbi:MAG TPA: LLM class flavin-dependent oxidoreductase [Candidatus Tectomicrobia bacterium]|jgi:alkanesulfonate monooxygenase SsuD/methylene tetrahydromethanopterin reductase-like flavin-dependent oxidoreductase (luciferase family)
MSETLFGGLPLHFGLFDWIEWDQAPASNIFEQRLQMLEYADQAGFFCYHLAEHHVTPLSVSPSPMVFLAASAQRTQRLRLGPLVYLLPFYNPLRLLHAICMLDHLRHGRLESGVGRGISPIEAQHFDLPRDGIDHLRPVADFDTLRASEVIIAGTPQTVHEQIQRAVANTGANYFCPIFAFGNLRHEQVMTSMRLFVQDVMSAWR